MDKRICVKCNEEFTRVKNGVIAVETFEDKQPYKIWMCDLFLCMQCNTQILAGFGQVPITEHFQENFQEILNNLKQTHTSITYF